MNRILVITTEPLPLAGEVTTGAGLRAWGLAQGLSFRGFHVVIATTAKQLSNLSNIRITKRDELGKLIANVTPDVVVMQHWGLMYALPPLDIPLAIDLAGPHLLERQYWGGSEPSNDETEKISALGRADFIVCGGERQRSYFYSFLQRAGYQCTKDGIPVIPFSVPPISVTGAPPPNSEITFIYGGAFLGWQNPENSIRWLLDELDKAGTGRLLFYGGSHPDLDASAGRFANLYRFLSHHSRVEMRGWKPFDELISEYVNEGHVALDLMEFNAERELAYTTRTMIYLYCGLPVIYNNYSELSELVNAKSCGWCLDPQDEPGFRRLVQSLVANPAIIADRRDLARTAASTQSWDKTITPLSDFCKFPTKRTKPSSHDLTSKQQFLPQKKTLLVICSKFKNILPRPGKYMGILVYIPVWIVCRYLSFSLKVTASSRAHKK